MLGMSALQDLLAFYVPLNLGIEVIASKLVIGNQVIKD